MATSPCRVLGYGGKGALGSTIVTHFKAKNWVCISVVKVMGLYFSYCYCKAFVINIVLVIYCSQKLQEF